MSKTRLFDLTIERHADQVIRLTQQDGINDPHIIDLNPAQLLYLADRFAAAPDRMMESIQCRLLELQNDLHYFGDHDLWIVEIAERLSNGLVFQVGMNTMRYAIDSIVADLGLKPLND